MKFKPAVWFPVATALSAVNLWWVGIAADASEPWHAFAHGTVAVAFALWAQRLRGRRAPAAMTHDANEVALLESEVSQLRRELTEAQARLDFTERLLEQRPESQQVPRNG